MMPQTILAMPKTAALFARYMGEENGSSSLEKELRIAFEEETAKYTKGNWDIIGWYGKKRWPYRVRKTMENDYMNWYNAEIKTMTLQFDRTLDGMFMPKIYILAHGQNVEGDGFVPLDQISFYKPWTSKESIDYKRGY